MSAGSARPNPWVGCVVIKLTPIRSGRPICYFSARFPVLELTLAGCTLWLTRAGKPWAAPPKQRRQLPDNTTEWSDLVSSMFNEACLTAIAAHSPELLQPLIEGRSEPAPLALPSQQRTRPAVAPPHAPDWWERDR
jgi:hypothetical protein